MASLIDDDIVDAFSIVAPTEQLASALRTHCDGLIDRVTPIFMGAGSDGFVTEMIQELRGQESGTPSL
jgi:hypothetical protein